MSEDDEKFTVTDEGLVISPPYISPKGELSISVASTFTYGGHQHWPKTSVTDSPEVMFDDDGNAVTETSDSLLFRVSETAHMEHAKLVSRMKYEIHTRLGEERTARNSSTDERNQK